MQVQIIDVEIENKGKYQQATVYYKNLDKGTSEDKKVMSFTNKDVFNTIKSAKKGDTFSVQLSKNDKGYWEWTAISTGNGAPEPQKTSSSGNPTPRSTYETPEERAQKQVYIVRQSSLANAIETLKTDKKIPSKEEVVDLAKYYESYVFGNISTVTPLAELPFDEDDDVPV